MPRFQLWHLLGLFACFVLSRLSKPSGALAATVYYHWILFTYDMLSLEFWGVGGACIDDNKTPQV